MHTGRVSLPSQRKRPHDRARKWKGIACENETLHIQLTQGSVLQCIQISQESCVFRERLVASEFI